MKKEITNIELIEKKLEGRISKQEKQEFEERLKDDSSFKVLVEDINKLIKGIELSARHKLLSNLKETESGLQAVQIESAPKVIKLRKYKYAIAIAATIVLLIGSVYTIIISRDNGIKEDFLTSYYTPYPNIIHPLQRAEETVMTDEELAYYYYESGQYEQALELFMNLNTDSSNLESTQFYLANIQMILGNYEKAIEIFLNLLKDSIIFENQSKWYLSLCYLEDGNYADAQQQLEQIIESDNSYKERAEELLIKIRKD